MVKINCLILFLGYVSYAEEDRKVFYLRMRYQLPKPGSKAKNDGYMVSYVAKFISIL